MKDSTLSQILHPTNACQSHPTLINAVKISLQNAVLHKKICNVILINHNFWQVWNILSLTKCIMLCIIIILPDHHLWAKTSQIQCSTILSTRTQHGASVQLFCKAFRPKCVLWHFGRRILLESRLWLFLFSVNMYLGDRPFKALYTYKNSILLPCSRNWGHVCLSKKVHIWSSVVIVNKSWTPLLQFF